MMHKIKHYWILNLNAQFRQFVSYLSILMYPNVLDFFFLPIYGFFKHILAQQTRRFMFCLRQIDRWTINHNSSIDSQFLVDAIIYLTHLL